MNLLTKQQREDSLALLKRTIETVTVNPGFGEKTLAGQLADFIRSGSCTVEVHEFEDSRANVFARLRGRSPGKSLMLNGHLDTVPFGERGAWSTPPDRAVVSGGRLFGRGAADMKSGLCAALYAFCSLAREGFTPERDIVFLGTGDEESGGLGAADAVKRGLLDDVCGIVIGEPTGGRISVASKGTLWLKIEVFGKTSHAAYPWEGVNAIEAACALVSEIKALLPDCAHPYLTAPTCSLTTMSGGVKTNMIPDRCELSLDIRTTPGINHAALLERVETLIARQEKLGAKLTLTVQNDRMAVEAAPDAALTRALCDAVARSRGVPPGLTGTGFFSDASIFLRDCDIPTVLFGPGESSQAHKPNESVALEEYYSAVECYREFLLGC